MPRIFVRHYTVVALSALRSRVVALLSAGLASLAAASPAGPVWADANQHFPGASDFVDHINNPFFPLVPGTTFVYAGTKDGQPESDRFYVSHLTKTILGVRTTVIIDRGFINGRLEELTHDYFAQDRQGNVWYFGEDTKELDATGKVISTEGTWRAGRNNAQPGIVMEAHPEVGDTYHQELARGVAEDMATVLTRDASLTVPAGAYHQVLETREFSPLEPAVVEHKFYARGIGDILEIAVKGDHEILRLVAIHRPDDDQNDDDEAD
jgi:hypothetical protein